MNILHPFFRSALFSIILLINLIIAFTAHASEMIVLDVDSDATRQAVQKVRSILQTMQAREKDYATVINAFKKKFEDPNAYTDAKLQIIDPFWSRLVETTGNTQGTKSEQLRQKHNRKQGVMNLVQDSFQQQWMKANNAVKGFQMLIDCCENFLESNSMEKPHILESLLDILVKSHLFGLKNVCDQFISSSIKLFSHISLKGDEIDIDYTQDSRLKALTEVNYIIDYMRPISILMKLGLKPNGLDWSFAENLQEYVNGSLSLDEPSVFLLDGFLYNKGIEKAQVSLKKIDLMLELGTRTDRGGIFNSNLVEVKLLTLDEKKQAIEEYTQLVQLHQERVQSYIKSLKLKELEQIKKSREFLEACLKDDLQNMLNPKPKTTPIVVSNHPQAAKKKGRGKQGQPNQQKKNTPKPTPLILSQSETEITTMATSTQATLSVEPLVSSEQPMTQSFVEIIPVPQVEEEIKPTAKPLSNKMISNNDNTARPLSLIHQDKNHNTKGSINNKILQDLLDAQASPFTIDYTKALNAMSKIGIFELKPKRHGDFRKLVRRDQNDNIIGKVFAYKPATSTLGYELMKIYRTFIQQQLDDLKIKL